MNKTACETGKTTRKLSDRRKDNLSQILHVAERLFAERGYSGTTIAAIADEVKLPKANILYYFKTKEGLYKALLEKLFALWIDNMQEMTEDSHPRVALKNYIANKIQQSKENPNASRIFAAEVLHGPDHLKAPLEGPLKKQFEETCRVFRCWIKKQWMDPINPEHLIFMLWSSTQAYADHSQQISILIEKKQLDDDDFTQGRELLTQVILKGCGIA